MFLDAYDDPGAFDADELANALLAWSASVVGMRQRLWAFVSFAPQKCGVVPAESLWCDGYQYASGAP